MADEIPGYLQPNEAVSATNVAPLQSSPLASPDAFKTPEAPPVEAPPTPVSEGVELFDHVHKAVIRVPDTEVETLIQTGQYTPKKGERFIVKNPDSGELQDIDSSELHKALSGGYKMETSQERDARELERDYGGKGLQAFAEGAARAITLGGSDVALTKTGAMTPEELRKTKEANPYWEGTGQAVGIGTSLLLPGLGEAGLAAKAGKAASAGIRGAEAAGALAERQVMKLATRAGIQSSVATKIAAKIAQGGAEGAIYGGGNLVSENALGKADFNAENLVGALGGGALFGGALGGALGTAYAAAPGMKTGAKKLFSKVGEAVEGYTDRSRAASELLGTTRAKAEKINEISPKFFDELPDFLRDKVGIKTGESTEKMAEKLDFLKTKSGEKIGETLETLNDYFEQKVKPIGAEHSPVAFGKYESAMNAAKDSGTITAPNLAPLSEKELASAKHYVSPNGQSGYAIADDGAIVQIFAKNPAEFERILDDAVLNKGASKVELHGQNMPEFDKYFNVSSKSPSAYNMPEITSMKLAPEKLEQWNGVPTNRFFFDKLADDLAAKMESVTGKGTPGYSEQLAPVQRYISEIRDLAKEGGSLNAKRLQELKVATDKLNNKFNKSPGAWTLKNQAEYEVRNILKNEIDYLADVASKDNNIGNIAKELRDANKDYHYSSIAQSSVDKKLSGENFKKLGLKDYAEAWFALSNPIGTAVVLGKKYLDSDLRRQMVILGSLQKAQDTMNKHINTAVTEFLNPVVKGVARGARPTTMNALIRSNLSVDFDKNGKRPKTQAEAYANIQNNLNKFASNPEQLLELVNKKTSAIHPHAPQTSAALDMVASNAVNFLASKLPKDRQNRGMFDADKNRVPGGAEMAKFERYLDAIDNPKHAIKELESGVFTKESAEAIRAVYPNLFIKLKDSISDKMIKQKNIPYNKKLQIGMIFGTSADVSMQPENIMALQANISQPPAQPVQGSGGAAKPPTSMQSGSTQVADES